MKLKSDYKTIIIHAFIPVATVMRFLLFDMRKEIDLKLYEKFSGGLPFTVYSCIMLPLCGAKVFTSVNKNEGDGKIPYGFFDFYHQTWYVCLIISLLLIIFAIMIGILLDYLNKKIQAFFLQQCIRQKLEEFRLAAEKLIELQSNEQ